MPPIEAMARHFLASECSSVLLTLSYFLLPPSCSTTFSLEVLGNILCLWKDQLVMVDMYLDLPIVCQLHLMTSTTVTAASTPSSGNSACSPTTSNQMAAPSLPALSSRNSSNFGHPQKLPPYDTSINGLCNFSSSSTKHANG